MNAYLHKRAGTAPGSCGTHEAASGSEMRSTPETLGAPKPSSTAQNTRGERASRLLFGHRTPDIPGALLLPSPRVPSVVVGCALPSAPRRYTASSRIEQRHDREADAQ